MLVRYAAMSVNHRLLPISQSELTALLADPPSVHRLVEQRAADVRDLSFNAIAIGSQIAESSTDILLFVTKGAPDDAGGYIGKYVEEDGEVLEMEIDMGYGPPWYCKNSFLRKVARRLKPITEEAFAGHVDFDWMDENGIYPGDWSEQWRRDHLLNSFQVFRECVLGAATDGTHLLIWSQ